MSLVTVFNLSPLLWQVHTWQTLFLACIQSMSVLYKFTTTPCSVIRQCLRKKKKNPSYFYLSDAVCELSSDHAWHTMWATAFDSLFINGVIFLSRFSLRCIHNEPDHFHSHLSLCSRDLDNRGPGAFPSSTQWYTKWGGKANNWHDIATTLWICT